METLIQVTNLSGSTIILDLYDDVSVNLNMSFAEIQDITSRNSGYSQTFRVPGTPINNSFFNYMFNVNADNLSFDIQKSVLCSINYKGNTILDGILRLLKIIITNDKVEYEVNIQDEVGVFINNISNKLLTDIDYTDLNHTYNATNVKASWNAVYTGTTTSGGLKEGQILYPFTHIGYLYDDTGNIITSGNTSSPVLELYGNAGSISNVLSPMRTTGFKPAIQIKSVLNRIFQQNGYTLESEFCDTEYFNRLYMPLIFNNDGYYISATGATIGTSQVAVSITDTPQGFSVSGTTCAVIQGWVELDRYIYNNGATYPPYGWNFASGRFIAPQNGSYTFTYSLDLEVPSAFQDNQTGIYGEVYLLKNRTTQYMVNPYQTFPDIFNFQVSVSSGTPITIPLLQDDFIEMVVKYYIGDPYDCIDSRRFVAPNVIKDISVVTITDAPNNILGSTVDVNNQFEVPGTYKQLDFIKGLITQFNLVFVKHPYLTNTYIMEPYSDYVGQGDTLDWTDKLDVSKPIEISPITNLVGKAIDFVFEEDSDEINNYTKTINNNRNFGTYNFIPSGITLNDKPLEIKTFFSPSPGNYLQAGNTSQPLICPHFYGIKQVTVSGSTVTQLLPMRIKPRILYYCGLQNISASWYFRDEVTSTTEEYTTYPFLHHQELLPSTPAQQAVDLNFGNNNSPQDAVSPSFTNLTAYNLYYADYIEDLLDADARMVSANFFLNIEDVTNLKYSDLIFVKDAYYRINKIINFNLLNYTTTKVELVKLLTVDIESIPVTPTPTPTITPTATPTNTPTPTPTATNTPTPTPTSTPAPVGQCYCFPIYVTGNTLPPPEGGTIATLVYNDCFGVETYRAFTTGPGIYKQCIQTISSVVQFNPLLTEGIDQSYLTLTYLEGNCNTGFVCEGYTPVTPTPTPTATNTPTPTPTATPEPPTPTPTSTATPTPTPTVAPVGQCYCFPIYVTGNTLPPPEGGVIATLVYNDCFGVQTARAFTTGPGVYKQCIQTISSVVQYDPILTEGIDQSYLTLTYLEGNCNTGYVCEGYTPATPTPTPTSTPTPTPTSTPEPPTPTPTSTATPTPTVTPTPTIDPYFYYLVEEYGCLEDGSCEYLGEFYVANNVALTIFEPNPRYRLDPTTELILRVTEAVSPQPGATLTTMSGAGFVECSSLCPQPPTPTPTATGTPTPTPTNTPEPPTPTPTATATPTPTPDPFFYYDAEQYGCGLDGNCVFEDYVTLRNVTEITLLNRFRNDPVSGKKFKVTNSISPGSFDYETAMIGPGTLTCSTLCPQPPTPTPTATGTPTPTPTNTPEPPTPTPTGTPTPTPTNTPEPPTPTPTSTPTPTPTIDPNFYYLAEEYECLLNGNCQYVSDIYISNNVALTIAPIPRYRLDPTSGLILRVITEVAPQVALITTMSGSGQINCSAFCAQPPTPTPTGTPTGTPTPTPTSTPQPPTPTPTATATPTPTPSPTPDPFFYYDAEQYTCGEDGNCVFVEYVVIRNVSVISIFNRFRNDPVSGFKFKVTNSVPSGSYDFETAMIGAGTLTCSTLCPQPPTPTPTGTPTPTPTSTPEPPTPTPTATPTNTPEPPTPTPTGTPTPTPTTEPPTSFTISWYNNSVTTGTNLLQIFKNGTGIVYQEGLGNGSFSVVATDVITYSLYSTTPDFTQATISVNTYGTGTVSDCNFSSALAVDNVGVSFTANGTIDGITDNYVDGCP